MSDNAVVLDYYDSLLRESDVKLLQEACWLNDSVIGFAFEYFERELFKDYGADVTFVSPQVTQCVKLMSADEARLMLEPIGIQNKKFVFFAVNDNSSAATIGGSHWSLLMFSKVDQACYHYDSMHGGNFEAGKRVYNFVKILTKSPHLRYIEAKTPQQQNCCDCGIYLICITEFLCRERLCPPPASSTSNAAAANFTLEKSVTPQAVAEKRHDLKKLIESLRGKHFN
jgi:sentrin-specific protease 8